MTYTLYYSPGAASMAVHWMLIEARIPFEARLVDIDTGAQHSAEYLRLNPAGRVPTLVVDGVPRHECTALLMLLAARHPDVGLAPPPGSPDRAEWLELMVFLPTRCCRRCATGFTPTATAIRQARKRFRRLRRGVSKGHGTASVHCLPTADLTSSAENSAPQIFSR
jgi:glutathione S-transferase